MRTRIETWSFLQVVSTSKLTAVLTGALLCVAGGWSKAQSVTFSGAPIALPVSGLVNPAGLAIDGAGDIYVAEPSLNEVVVLFKTLTGYAPPTKVPITGYYGLNSPYGVALDSAGDTFVADTVNSQVLKGSPETGYPARRSRTMETSLESKYRRGHGRADGKRCDSRWHRH